MRAHNPLYIPRNHLVEAALNAAVQSDNCRPFEKLLGVVAKPYERRSGLERFGPRPDRPWPSVETRR